jgi:protein TonB
MSRRWFGSVAFALLAGVSDARAQVPSMPVSGGRTVEASDGDVVVVPDGARVAIVRRSHVQARLVYLPSQQTVLLFTDPAAVPGDGMRDMKGLRRWQVMDPWPLEPRWEGSAIIDEYMPGPRSPIGLAIHTDRGTVFIGHVLDREFTLSPPPIAIVRISGSSMRMAQGTFDELEQAWLAGGDAALGGPGAGAEMRTSAPRGGMASASISAVAAGALRVGGNIRVPTKTHSVDPVYPQAARDAGVQGVVILELTVGEDGAVSNARVLRSIPLLDAAAIDAVRQWRYTPTLLNGVPTPVVMTATVNFTLSSPPQ